MNPKIILSSFFEDLASTEKQTNKRLANKRSKSPELPQTTFGSDDLLTGDFVSNPKSWERSSHDPSELYLIAHRDLARQEGSVYLKDSGFILFLYPIREQFGNFLVDLSNIFSGDSFFKEAIIRKSGKPSNSSKAFEGAAIELNKIFSGGLTLDISGINPKNIYKNFQYISLLKYIIFPLMAQVLPDKYDYVQEVIKFLKLDDDFSNRNAKGKVLNETFSTYAPKLVDYLKNLCDKGTRGDDQGDKLKVVLENLADSIIEAGSSGAYEDPEAMDSMSKPSMMRDGKVTDVVAKNVYYALVSAYAGAANLKYLTLDNNKLDLDAAAKDNIAALKTAIENTAKGNKGKFFATYGGGNSEFFWHNYAKAKMAFTGEVQKLSKQPTEQPIEPSSETPQKISKSLSDIYSKNLESASLELTNQQQADFDNVNIAMQDYFSNALPKEEAIKTINDFIIVLNDLIAKDKEELEIVLNSDIVNDTHIKENLSNKLSRLTEEEKEQFFTELYSISKLDKKETKSILTGILFPRIESISKLILPHLEDIKLLISNIEPVIIESLENKISEIVVVGNEIQGLLDSKEDSMAIKQQITGKRDTLNKLFETLRTDIAKIAPPTEAGKKILLDLGNRIIKEYSPYDKNEVLERVSASLLKGPDFTEASVTPGSEGPKLNATQLRALIKTNVRVNPEKNSKHDPFEKLINLELEDLQQIALFILNNDKNQIRIYMRDLNYSADKTSPVNERVKIIASLMNLITKDTGVRFLYGGSTFRPGVDVYRKGHPVTSGEAMAATKESISNFLMDPEHQKATSISLFFDSLKKALKVLKTESEIGSILESGTPADIDNISDKDLLEVFTNNYGASSVIDLLSTFFTFTDKGNDPESIKNYYDNLRIYNASLAAGNTKVKEPLLAGCAFGKTIAKLIKSLAKNGNLFSNPQVNVIPVMSLDSSGNLPFVSKIINLLLSIEPRMSAKGLKEIESYYFPLNGDIEKIGLAATSTQRSGVINQILCASTYSETDSTDPLTILQFQYKTLKVISIGLQEILLPFLDSFIEEYKSRTTTEGVKNAGSDKFSYMSPETKEDILKAFNRLTNSLRGSLNELIGNSENSLSELLRTIRGYAVTERINIKGDITEEMGIDQLGDTILNSVVVKRKIEPILKNVTIFKNIASLRAITMAEPNFISEETSETRALFVCLSKLLTTSINYVLQMQCINAIKNQSKDPDEIAALNGAAQSLDEQNSEILNILYGGPSNPDRQRLKEEDIDKIKAFEYSHLYDFIIFIADDLKQSKTSRMFSKSLAEAVKQKDADNKKKEDFYTKVGLAISFTSSSYEEYKTPVYKSDIEVPKSLDELGKNKNPFSVKTDTTEAGREIKSYILKPKAKEVLISRLPRKEREKFELALSALVQPKVKFQPSEFEKDVTLFKSNWKSFKQKFKLKDKTNILDFFPVRGPSPTIAPTDISGPSKGPRIGSGEIINLEASYSESINSKLSIEERVFGPSYKLITEETAFSNLPPSAETFNEPIIKKGSASDKKHLENRDIILDENAFKEIFKKNSLDTKISTAEIPSKGYFYSNLIGILKDPTGTVSDVIKLVNCSTTQTKDGTRFFTLSVSGQKLEDVGKDKITDITQLSQGVRNIPSIKGKPGSSNTLGEGTTWINQLVQASTSVDEWLKSIEDAYPKSGNKNAYRKQKSKDWLDKQKLGDKIINLRKDKKNSDEKIAELLGISVDKVVKISKEHIASGLEDLTVDAGTEHIIRPELDKYINIISSLKQYFNLITNCINAWERGYIAKDYASIVEKAKPLNKMAAGHGLKYPIQALSYIKHYRTYDPSKDNVMLPEVPVAEGVEDDEEAQRIAKQKADEEEFLQQAPIKYAWDSDEEIETPELPQTSTTMDSLEDKLRKTGQLPIAKLRQLLKDNFVYIFKLLLSLHPTLSEEELHAAFEVNPEKTYTILKEANYNMPQWLLDASVQFELAAIPDAPNSVSAINIAKRYILQESPAIPKLYSLLYGNNSLKDVQIHFTTRFNTEFLPQPEKNIKTKKLNKPLKKISIINNSQEVLDILCNELLNETEIKISTPETNTEQETVNDKETS